MDGTLLVFERGAERFELHRQQMPNGWQLTMTGTSPTRTLMFQDAASLLAFQSDTETLLLKTGWSFTAFSPDRRLGMDRRTWPRESERRRWWTDGLRRPLLGLSRRRSR
jgi:hypothetical protein